MKIYTYINSNLSTNLNSALYPLFHQYTGDNEFIISSSFLELDKIQYPIFTDINDFICKKIKEKKLTNYSFILDSYNLNIDSINGSNFNILNKADIIYLIGGANNLQNNGLNNLKNLTNVNLISLDLDKEYYHNISEEGFICIESESIGNLIEDISSEVITDISKVFIIDNQKINKFFWEEQFKELNIEVIFLHPSLENIKFLVENCNFLYPKSLFIKSILSNKETISISKFILEIKDKIKSIENKNIVSNNTNLENLINIVCYKPSYLFKDLVERFVNLGCIHSDFPLPGCKGYIWMRPQEIWHLEFLIKNMTHKEISNSYKEDSKKIISNLDLQLIKSRSVAIHHGTCFEPLYQFDPYLLAKSLYNVKKVVGVCEIEECYSPSFEIANKDNFIFVPIGYDHNLFTEDKISKANKEPKSLINIGFVGRAYGTTDNNLLNKSKMAEPKGYRKGGDILLNIIIQLKLKHIPFKLHILGQNWEELVNLLDEYNISYTYYARDKNIQYKDYPSVYAQLDTLLITARCEGGPVSAIEALSLGIPVISTNVGVIKYLNNNTINSVYSYQYNKKWHIADIAKALEFLENISNSRLNYEDRVAIRNQVAHLTTDNWVKKIINEV